MLVNTYEDSPSLGLTPTLLLVCNVSDRITVKANPDYRPPSVPCASHLPTQSAIDNTAPSPAHNDRLTGFFYVNYLFV